MTKDQFNHAAARYILMFFATIMALILVGYAMAAPPCVPLVSGTDQKIVGEPRIIQNSARAHAYWVCQDAAGKRTLWSSWCAYGHNCLSLDVVKGALKVAAASDSQRAAAFASAYTTSFTCDAPKESWQVQGCAEHVAIREKNKAAWLSALPSPTTPATAAPRASPLYAITTEGALVYAQDDRCRADETPIGRAYSIREAPYTHLFWTCLTPQGGRYLAGNIVIDDIKPCNAYLPHDTGAAAVGCRRNAALIEANRAAWMAALPAPEVWLVKPPVVPATTRPAYTLINGVRGTKEQARVAKGTTCKHTGPRLASGPDAWMTYDATGYVTLCARQK